MNINKVELKDFGNKGIVVSFNAERQINNQLSAKRDNKMTEYLPLPIPLRLEFHKLKYFFLTMIGVWRTEWTQYLLNDYSGFQSADDIDFSEYGPEKAEILMNEAISHIMAADTCFSKTKIFGYEVSDTKIKISGTFEVIEGKPFKPSLPFIAEDDDYTFYSEAYDIMVEISDAVMEYINQDQLKLENVKGILAEILNSDSDKERIESQNEEENYLELMHKLEGQGVVIPLAGSELEKQLGDGEKKADIKSSNTIDPENVNDSEDISSSGMFPKEEESDELDESSAPYYNSNESEE
jgi:hypothetical protein